MQIKRYFTLLVLSLCFAVAHADGTVSGTITDADTLQPVQGINICLINESLVFVSCGLTDAQGDYTAPSVTDGLYWVLTITGGSGYVQELYDDVVYFEYSSGATQVEVAGGDLSGIDFDLVQGFTISGHVEGRTSELPLEGLAVCIHRSDGSYTRVCGQTDVEGNYTTSGIPLSDTDVTIWVNAEESDYLSTLYDDIVCPAKSCDFISGTPISVGPEDAFGVDFELEVAATLSGIVVDAAGGAPVHPVEVDLVHPVTGEELGIGVQNEPDGTYQFSELGPGDYKIMFNAVDTASGYTDELHEDIPLRRW